MAVNTVSPGPVSAVELNLAVSATELALSVVTVKFETPHRLVDIVSCIPASSPECGARPRCQSLLTSEVASQLCSWSFPSFFFSVSSVSLSRCRESGPDRHCFLDSVRLSESANGC